MGESASLQVNSWMVGPSTTMTMESAEYAKRYFRNRNSRPIFTRFTPLYSMMSAVA